MANVNLKLVALDNANQTFGQTDYAMFNAETTEKQPVVVAVTHNALTRAGINLSLLDSLTSSTIVVKDDTDVRSGELVTGDSKVDRVINQEINPISGKPYQIVLLNSANCSILKSDLYLAENKDLASSISAKVVIEKEKERKLLSAKRASDRLRGLIGPKVEQKTEQSVDAELPTNEESPF
jgi:hypothetical protein